MNFGHDPFNCEITLELTTGSTGGSTLGDYIMDYGKISLRSLSVVNNISMSESLHIRIL